MAETSTTTTAAKPRRSRWILRSIGFVLLLIVVFVAFLPSLVTWGLGRSSIKKSITGAVAGTVDIGALRVSWFGEQALDNLTITDERGTRVADLSATVNAGLLQLLFSRPKPLEIVLRGSVAGEIEEDGSVSFKRLARSDSTPKPTKPPKAEEPFRMPELPALTVKLQDMTIDLRHAVSKQSVKLDKLQGELAYRGAAEPIKLTLHAKTLTRATPHRHPQAEAKEGEAFNVPSASRVEDIPGSIDVNGEVAGLFSNDRTINLAGAKATLAILVRTVPMPLLPVPAEILMLDLKVNSDDLTGRIDVALNASAEIDQNPSTSVRGTIGLNRLLAADAALALAGASADIDLEVRSLTVKSEAVRAEVELATLKVESQDLTKTIGVEFASSAMIDGNEASDLRGSLTLDRWFRNDGSIDVAVDRVTGSVTGKNVPTGLLDGPLADSGIRPSRDVGPVVNVEALFSAGESRDVTLAAKGRNATAEIVGRVNPADGSLLASRVFIQTPAAAPELVKALASLDVAGPTDVTLDLSSFRFPAADPNSGLRPLAEYGLTGNLRVKGPALVKLSDTDAMTISLQDADIRIESNTLGEGMKLRGTALADGAAVTIDETITNLFDASGAMAVLSATPVGTLKIQGMPVERIAAILPDQAALIRETMSDALTVTLTTTAQGDNLQAALAARAGSLTADVNATRSTSSLKVNSAMLELPATPGLLAALQEGAEPPALSLVQPTLATITVKPFELAGTFPTYDTTGTPIALTVALADAAIENVPSMSEPIGLAAFTADVTAQQTTAGFTLDVNGRTRVQRLVKPAAGAAPPAEGDSAPVTNAGFNASNIGTFTYTVKAVNEGERLTADVTLNGSNVAMRRLERAMGSPDAISKWTGDSGDIAVNMKMSTGDSSYRAVVEAKLPQIIGTFDASLTDDVIALTSQNARLMLPKDRVNELLGHDPKIKRKADEPGPALTADADVTLTPVIRAMRLPLAALSEESFDPAKVNIDLAMNSSPLKLIDRTLGPMTVDPLAITVTCADLSRGINFSLKGNALLAQAEKPGTIDLTGSMTELVRDGKRTPAGEGKLSLKGTLENVPTALFDGVANMDGLLVAAVGGLMQATLEADDFSPDTGTVRSKITTENGSLEAFGKGQEKSLRITKKYPIIAELAITKPLRERLLYNINPILADIRASERPLKATLNDCVIPLDGDISRLKAELTIEIGKVELDSGSALLSVMEFANTRRQEHVPGLIEPLVVNVNRGIVKYSNFTVKVGKKTPEDTGYLHQLVFEGEIDLVKKHVKAIKGEYPLDSLTKSIRDIPGVVGLARVGIEFSGDLYDAKGNPKPLSKRPTVGIDGNLLRDIFGR